MLRIFQRLKARLDAESYDIFDPNLDAYERIRRQLRLYLHISSSLQYHEKWQRLFKQLKYLYSYRWQRQQSIEDKLENLETKNSLLQYLIAHY